MYLHGTTGLACFSGQSPSHIPSPATAAASAITEEKNKQTSKCKPCCCFFQEQELCTTPSPYSLELSPFELFSSALHPEATWLASPLPLRLKEAHLYACSPHVQYYSPPINTLMAFLFRQQNTWSTCLLGNSPSFTSVYNSLYLCPFLNSSLIAGNLCISPFSLF